MLMKRQVSQRSLCLMLGALAGLAGCSASEPVELGANETSSEPQMSPTKQPKTSGSAATKSQGRRIKRLHGMIASGSSPDAAAENFRQTRAKDLGVDPVELVLVAPSAAAQLATNTSASSANAAASQGLGLLFNSDTGTYKFRLYTYVQQRDGVPVYGGGLRTLVRVDGDNSVVWANTDLRPLGNFSVPNHVKTAAADPHKSLTALKTDPVLAARALVPPAALGEFSQPTPTIFAGLEDQVVLPRMALKYTAREQNGPSSWTFIADAETGDVLHVESNQHYSIDGTVKAKVTAGVEAMECGMLASEPLPYAKISSAAGAVFADKNGSFSLEASGSGTVSLLSTITGEYFDVIDKSASLNSISLEVTPPGPADFFHQDLSSPPEIVLAQLNAYKQANAIRDLLLSHVPEYPIIATELGFQINVNHTGESPRDLCVWTGGAWYDDDRLPRSINFCQRTDGRTNTAMGSIIHHEYGHHIIEAGGSKQSQYGEGMADTIAMLFSGDPAISVGYGLDCNESLRTANNTCQYSETDCSSCGAGIYECGALISGTVWDIWQQLKITDPLGADDVIRSLVFSSIPMHTGVSIDPSLAIDMLTLDDDDALLENGTPHYQEICTGFGLHNMDCPPIVDGLVVHGPALEFSGPSNGPFEPESTSFTLYNLGPEQSLSYAVQIPTGATWLTVDSAAGSIPLGSQQTVTVSIDQAHAAALPNGRYTTAIDFVNVTTGLGTVSRDAHLRVGAPEPVYTASFDDGLDGFVVDDSSYNNLWHQTSACVDSLPNHSSPGSLYYGRDDQCSHDTSVPDRHGITSPTIHIDNAAIVDLGFNYYLRTERPGSDLVEILMSVSGGPFEIVASNETRGELLDETTRWVAKRFEISELLPGSGPVDIQLQLAFDAGSPGDNSETGFLIDDITVYATPPSSSSGVSLPARVQAEDYVRYNDTTAGNQGGGCATADNVDKELTSDSAGGGCNVGWTEAGEWLEYDISVPTAQSFDIVTRVASQNAGKSFRIEIDGVDVTGALSVPVKGWQNYSDVKAAGVALTAGDHVVRLFMITNYINVNYIDFQAVLTGPICGDNMCSGAETCGTCAQDCGTCTGGCTCPSGCSSVQNASAPFTREGVTNTCYFIHGSVNGHINSWNMSSLNLNGMNVANFWLSSTSYPATIDGGYYLYVGGSYRWSHVEFN